MGSPPAATIIGETSARTRRGRGGSFKTVLLSSDIANVTDPATGTSQKTTIERVLKNAANVDYERRGVITKGSVIETPLGQARVVSRPGQHGVVNAILIEKAK